MCNILHKVNSGSKHHELCCFCSFSILFQTAQHRIQATQVGLNVVVAKQLTDHFRFPIEQFQLMRPVTYVQIISLDRFFPLGNVSTLL